MNNSLAVANDNFQPVLGRQGGRIRICLMRHIHHDVGRVWEMLTDSARLPDWLAPGRIELQPGGAVGIDFGMSGTPINSRITALRVPELLEYSWSDGDEPQRPLRWELTPLGEETLLSLTLLLPDDDRVALSCAGWDCHLEMLLAALEGIAIHFPATHFRNARQSFSQRLEAMSE